MKGETEKERGEPERKQPEREQLSKVEAALKNFPDHPKLNFTAGILYFNRGEVSQALFHFEKVLEKEPENPELYNFLGLGYYELGHLEKARSYYQTASSLEPKNPQYLNNLGVVFLQSGNPEKAIECFKKALLFAKRDALLYSNLGVALLELGDAEEAHKAFERALRYDPGEITANYYLGSSFGGKGEVHIGDLVKVGELVRVYPAVSFKLKNYTHLYSSRVEDIDENSITIAAPMRRGIPIPFHSGARLLVGVPKSDALYGFHSEVIERKGGQVPLLRLRRQPRAKRIQRRRYVRVPSNLNVAFKILEDASSGKPGGAVSSKKIREKNISGGGLLLLLERPISEGSLLLVSLRLPDGYLETVGKVVRCREEEEHEGVFEVAICWTTLSEKERDRIIQYVNQQTVSLRKKGILS